MAVQAFTFGFVGSKLDYPDAILWILFVFPLISSFWKVALIWLIFGFKLKDLELRLFMSPFVVFPSCLKKGKFVTFEKKLFTIIGPLHYFGMKGRMNTMKPKFFF